MTVEEHSLNLLHLKRSPGIRSWSLLVGKRCNTFWLYCIPNEMVWDRSFLFIYLFILLCIVCRYCICWFCSCILQLRCATFILHQFEYKFPDFLSETVFVFLCGDIDSIFWKLFYVTGCLFVAMQNMEEWEEAVFDKTKNLIELKSFSLYAFFLTLWRKGHEKGWSDQFPLNN